MSYYEKLMEVSQTIYHSCGLWLHDFPPQVIKNCEEMLVSGMEPKAVANELISQALIYFSIRK